ncbi:hypothetical protein M0R45_017748 [Rubus argutus]|uniref:Uncharacterized protein n=1 Tax=Rubus argutus TaxID=59490 RepID=A0AAW1XXC8_RUBAR
MLKSMLKTGLFSHAKKMRDRQPCRLNIGKHLCCSNQPKFEERAILKVQPPAPPEEKKDLFLYLEMGQKLCRLNIRELCERWSHSNKPQFEVVHVFNPNDFVYDHYMIVGNSKLSNNWGHKQFVSGYVFDARQEKWEPTHKKECLNEGFKAVVEFQGFLIGVYRYRYQRKHSYQIVANYQMESNWDREPDQVLHELQGPMPIISAKVEASSEIIDARRDAKSIVSSASALCHHLNTMPQKRDWFLYLNMGKRLGRVNITEFCERSSPNPQFEVVHSFPEEGHPSPIPRRMRHVTVGSKSYMVGGERVDGNLYCDANGRCFPSPNLDIFAFDPTHNNGPLITMCNGDIPRLIDPKTKTIPIVTSIEEKIYVLAKIPYLGEAEELDDEQAPIFKLDSNGVFKPYKVLHELEGIFRTCLLVCDYSMGKCDDDRIWLVYSGKDGLDFWNTWVVVLRVLTSIDNVGNSVLLVAIEAEECLHSNWCRLQISSAFSLCHQLKKNLDIEGKTCSV